MKRVSFRVYQLEYWSSLINCPFLSISYCFYSICQQSGTEFRVQLDYFEEVPLSGRRVCRRTKEETSKDTEAGIEWEVS